MLSASALILSCLVAAAVLWLVASRPGTREENAPGPLTWMLIGASFVLAASLIVIGGLGLAMDAPRQAAAGSPSSSDAAPPARLRQ